MKSKLRFHFFFFFLLGDECTKAVSLEHAQPGCICICKVDSWKVNLSHQLDNKKKTKVWNYSHFPLTVPTSVKIPSRPSGVCWNYLYCFLQACWIKFDESVQAICPALHHFSHSHVILNWSEFSWVKKRAADGNLGNCVHSNSNIETNRNGWSSFQSFKIRLCMNVFVNVLMPQCWKTRNAPSKYSPFTISLDHYSSGVINHCFKMDI